MSNAKLKCPSCGNEIDIKLEGGKCNTCYKIRNAYNTLYNYKDYKKSLGLYMELYKEYPKDKQLLLGVVLSISHEFTRIDYSVGERRSLVYYCGLYKKLANNTEINKYKNEMESISEELVKQERKENKKRNIQNICVASVIIVLVIYYILCLTLNPKKLDTIIRISDINTVTVDNLIKHKLLKCDVDNYELVNNNMVVSFICDNVARKHEKFSFEYSFVDDFPPEVKSAECKMKAGSEFDSSCIQIYDSVDGDILDFEVDKKEANFSEVGDTYVKVTAKDKAGNELSSEVKITIE